MTFSVRAPAQKSQSEGHFRESNAPPARLQSSESKPHWQPYMSNWESNNGRPIRGFGGFLRLICELNSEAPLHLINGDTPLHLATYLRQHENTHTQSIPQNSLPVSVFQTLRCKDSCSSFRPKHLQIRS